MLCWFQVIWLGTYFKSIACIDPLNLLYGIGSLAQVTWRALRVSQSFPQFLGSDWEPKTMNPSKIFYKKETQSNFWNEIKTFLIRSFERNFFCSTTPDNGHKTRAQEDEDNTGGLHRPFGGIEKSMAVRNWDDGRLLRIWNEFPETKSWKQINEFEEDFDWTINSVWKINFSTFAKI